MHHEDRVHPSKTSSHRVAEREGRELEDLNPGTKIALGMPQGFVCAHSLLPISLELPCGQVLVSRLGSVEQFAPFRPLAHPDTPVRRLCDLED
jgi:hypothetical protein